MSASENEALVRRFLEEAYNQGNLSVGDELLAESCVFYTPAPIPGIAGWKQFATAFFLTTCRSPLTICSPPGTRWPPDGRRGVRTRVPCGGFRPVATR